MAHQEHPSILPLAIDEIATKEPESIYGKYPADPNNYDVGFKTVTYSQLANAIDGVAQWLETEIGRGDNEGTPVIAYIGPNDFRYVFAFVGAMKAGYKLFLTSPRNSLVAHLSLLNNLECASIIVAGPIPSTVDEILKQRPMRLLDMAETEHFISHTFQPYPYRKTWATAKGDGAFVCHTSGTTGIPKPCIYTHDFILRVARTCSVAAPAGYTSLQSLIGGNTHILLLPLFHPGGVQLGILNAIYNRTAVILPSWKAPPSIESLMAILRNTGADWAMAAPFTLEALAKDDAMLDQVAAHLKMLVFAGGSLPKALGDVIAKKIRLASFLGSGETAGLPILYPDGLDSSKDWEYMRFHPKAGAINEPRTENSFELVLQKSASTEPYQPVFTRYPEQERFHTGDLFIRHPTRYDMWAHASRADDIIVFLNGEKTNPVSFESHMSKHSDVEGALMFGSQRFEAGLLVELKVRGALSPQDTTDYIQRLWPTIEEANQDSPAHARVSTSHVLFTVPAKPFLRTPKGTVMRKATLSLYDLEIDKLYETVELGHTEPSTSSDSKANLDDLEAVVEAIQKACKEFTTLGDVGMEDDLLAGGADSLQILRLCRNLRSKVSLELLKPTMVYLNPTPLALAKAIQKVARGQDQLANENDTERTSRLQEALGFFTRRIDQIAETQSQTVGKKAGAADPHVCIVTGTTGSIGSYVLRSLIENEHIGSIYCLNRGSDSKARQSIYNSAVDQQLPTSFPTAVHFLEADLAHDTFGLEPGLFETLSSSVTLVIHIAWAVDFNLPLSSFTQHLSGVENLCKFSAQSSQRPGIMFLSSVSAIMNLALHPDKVVPEEIIDDPSAPAAAGYGESKYIAEHMLDYAAKRLHIPIMVARIGQVCGAARSPGRWNPREWLPRLILGSVSLGAIPDSLGDYNVNTMDVDWIPVDLLADAMIEILLEGWVTPTEGQPTRSQVYHLMNPKRTSWANMLPTIVRKLEDLRLGPAKNKKDAGASTAVVSRQEWIKRLRDAANGLDTIESGQGPNDTSPALQLVDFYEEKLEEKVSAHWGMENATSTSTILQQVNSITPQDMEKWIRLW